MNLFLAGLITIAGFAGTDTLDTSAHKIFSSAGTPSDWENVIQQASSADAILVGEQHDDSIGHLIELEILRRLLDADSDASLAVSFEMFQTDVQYIVD